MQSTGSQALRGSSGLSLLEVLVALAILGVGIAGLVGLYSSSLRNTRNAADYSRGMVLAKAVMDETLAQQDPSDPYSLKVPPGFDVEKTVAEDDEAENTRTYEITVRITLPDGHVLEIKSEKTVNNAKQQQQQQ